MDNNQEFNQDRQNTQTNEQYQQSQPLQPIQQDSYQHDQYQQNQYQQNQYQYQQYQPPYQGMGPLLKTDRSVWKFILFSILTCGIYPLIFFSGISDDINRIASGRDGKKTMHYCLMAFIFSPLTCGIYQLYWWHTISERIGEETRARGIYTDFGAMTFWLWYVVGSLICGLGPLMYVHMLCKTMNELNTNYNQFGR